MKPEHKRIVDMASGWEDSEAVVSLAPADALVLASVGAPVKAGRRETDPPTITGHELYAAAQKLKEADVATPAGGQPTPNQQSIGPPAPPEPGAPVGPADPEPPAPPAPAPEPKKKK